MILKFRTLLTGDSLAVRKLLAADAVGDELLGDAPGRDQLVDVVAPAIEFLLTEGFANPGDEQVGSELNIIVTARQRAAKIYR